MVGFIDVYLLPVPRKNLAAYRRLAKAWGRVMRDHGVLTYREFAAAKDGVMKGMPSVAALVKPTKGEVAVFGVAGFRSRAHRDRTNAAAMKDPRMAKMTATKPLFDMKRMHVGGFETLVQV